MPTGPDKRNAAGLTKAAKSLREVTDLQRKLATKLTTSKAFATKFDDAVMSKNAKGVRSLLREAGITRKVTIEELDPDRKIRITVCVFRICGSITIEW